MRSNEATLHDVRILSREIKRRCAEHDISVRYVAGLDTAYSTPDSIVLPALEMPLSNEDMHLIRYYMIHEVGHHLRNKSFDLLTEAALTNKNAHSVWNMLEDEQLERDAQARFFGDRKSLCIGRDIHITNMLNLWSEQSQGGKLKPSEDTAKAVAVHAVCCASREWHPQVEHLVESMLEVCGEQVREWYTTLMDEGWVERIAAPLDEEQTRDLAMELFSRLWPEQEAGKAPEQQPEQGEGKGEPKEGEGEAQQNGDGNPEENQEDGESKDGKCSKNKPSSQEHGDEDEEGKTFTIPWDKIVGSEHSDTAPSTTPMEIDYTGWHQGSVMCYPDDHIRTVEVDDSRHAWRHSRKLVYNPDTTFANQMRRHIQSEARDRWETNRKTGRLNVRAIKRIKTGTKEHNRRIFKRRFDHEAINTCITVLVDWSGSMYGGRDEIAANAAGLLVDSFERVLRVPVEVLAHSAEDGELVMYKIKPYGDRADGETVVKRLRQHEMMGNADGDALLYTWDRIKTRPEKRKIIIAIADGQPADVYQWHSDPGSVLKYAIDEVRKSKVEVYGIGAQHPGIKEWYGDDSEVVMNLEEMSRVLLRVAEKFVLKG